MDVKDKVVVVTCGAQGIGLALGTRFARGGAHVVLSDLRQEACERQAAPIGALPVAAEGREDDIANREPRRHLHHSGARPVWRFLSHFWIGAGAVDAERSLLYLGGAGVATDLPRLLVWAAVIVALLLLPVSRKLERERERAHDARPVATAVGAAV